MHKKIKLIIKNLPDAINNAYTTLEQTLCNNNPQGKRIRFCLNVVDDHNNSTDINIIEDLLEEIVVNLFSNSVKYQNHEVKIDVLIKEYFIAEVKYLMITVIDYGKGKPDSEKGIVQPILFKRL